MLDDPYFQIIMDKINVIIHEDTSYQKGCLPMRTQKCFAIKVSNCHHQNIQLIFYNYSFEMLCMRMLRIPTLTLSLIFGTRQLQVKPHVAGLWLSPGKPTRRTVITMESIDFDQLLGPSFQRYIWQVKILQDVLL